MNNASGPVLACHSVTKVFTEGPQPVEVLRGIDFKIHSGEKVAIVGASGEGKSTLLHLLGGLDSPTTGEVTINGKAISGLTEAQKSQLRNQYLGFVYQFHHLLPEFNAVENVAMPLLIRGTRPQEAQEKARNLMAEVGLSHRLLHRVGELSGGERQRVAIARALVTDPICVLADEPTGNLDYKTAENVLATMLALKDKLNTSFIIVTHDMVLAQKMDRVLTIQEGKLN